jgi:hypothetical protein
LDFTSGPAITGFQLFYEKKESRKKVTQPTQYKQQIIQQSQDSLVKPAKQGKQTKQVLCCDPAWLELITQRTAPVN